MLCQHNEEKDKDVCGSLMKRLADERHFARKAKCEQ